MSERERYRLRGFYYLYNGNWQKCAEEYSELVNNYPGTTLATTIWQPATANCEIGPRPLKRPART